MRCPVCGASRFLAAIPVRTVEREIGIREEFVRSRLARKASPGELKDLTDFMHGFAAPLKQCGACGLLARDEKRVRTAASYSKDKNDPDVMRELLPRYVQAFRNKAPGFQERLRPHAEVLELGSHLGAFLEVAEEWNWRPVGLDVGCDTADFAKKRGLTIRRAMLEDAQLAPKTFDAVFVWNCFEQMTNPARTLREIYNVLRAGGLLTIRIPNAEFYLASHSDTALLGWNNLLGFPYLFGYSPKLVTRLLGQYGFEDVSGFNSELITMPFAELTAPIAEEQRKASARVSKSQGLTGPWVEMIYRKTEHPANRADACVDPHFLPRAG